MSIFKKWNELFDNSPKKKSLHAFKEHLKLKAHLSLRKKSSAEFLQKIGKVALTNMLLRGVKSRIENENKDPSIAMKPYILMKNWKQ